ASVVACTRWSRTGRTAPVWYSVLGAVVEIGVVTAAMAVLDALSPLGRFEALSAPAILGYPLVTTMSILRLKPRICVATGALGAMAHWALVAWAIRASGIERHEWPMLFQYGVWVFMSGIGAAL